jgi:acetyl esterase/lipase
VKLNRRDLIRSAGALALAGGLEPAPSLAALPESNPTDMLKYVHPELRPAAQTVMQMSAKMPSLNAATLASMRKSGPPPIKLPDRPDVPVSQHRVPVTTDSTNVTVYVINSKPGTRRPAILHTHGGGFVMGTADWALGPLKVMAAELDCTIATVDYRLAPETRYSGSIEDNYAGCVGPFERLGAEHRSAEDRADRRECRRRARGDSRADCA